MTGNPSLVLGIDVGGTSIKGALLDRTGTARAGHRVPTPVAEGPEHVVEAIESLADHLVRDSPGKVVAAGVAVPGHVDQQTGIARYAANLGWREVPLRDRLMGRLGVPVVLAHDVRAAGLAERELGLTREVADSLLVIIGTGIAATITSGGQPIVGAIALAGELGHIPVAPGGEACSCGQSGCLEVYASASGIARRYRAAGGGAELTGIGAAEIVSRLPFDPIAGRIWAEAVSALAFGLTTATLLVDPELIVIGGGLSAAGPALLDPLRAGIGRRLAWRSPPRRIELSPLGESAGRLGAGLLAWQLLDSHA